jgi:hypothetical protein
MLRVNNHPIGKNSPNPVTLTNSTEALTNLLRFPNFPAFLKKRQWPATTPELCINVNEVTMVALASGHDPF